MLWLKEVKERWTYDQCLQGLEKLKDKRDVALKQGIILIRMLECKGVGAETPLLQSTTKELVQIREDWQKRVGTSSTIDKCKHAATNMYALLEQKIPPHQVPAVADPLYTIDSGWSDEKKCAFWKGALKRNNEQIPSRMEVQSWKQEIIDELYGDKGV